MLLKPAISFLRFIARVYVASFIVKLLALRRLTAIFATVLALMRLLIINITNNIAIKVGSTQQMTIIWVCDPLWAS